MRSFIDLPMTDASPADLVDPMIIEEPSYQSLLRVTAVVPFNPVRFLNSQQVLRLLLTCEGFQGISKHKDSQLF